MSPVSLLKPDLGRSARRLIVREGQVVGELEVERFWNRSRTSMVEAFTDEVERWEPFLAHLGVPDTTNVTWVYDLRVPARLRGQGIARQALACLFEKKPGLILLQVGAATGARMNQEARMQTYQRLGFTLFDTGAMLMGARWDGPAPALEVEVEPVTPARRRRMGM